MSHADRAFALPPDWDHTQLGPSADWPACLQVTVDIMLNCPAAMVLMWSQEQIMVCNRAYAELCGNPGLRLPGGNVPPVQPPAWSWNPDVIQRAWQGQTSQHPGQALPTLQQGSIDHQIVDLYYTPIRDHAGQVAGILCTLTPGQAPSLAPAGSSMRILVVEDNPDAQYLVCETLRALGHEVEAVASGEDALPHLAAADFDVLFTDVSLPGMSGVELARTALRSQPDLALLFASGYGDDFTRHLDFAAHTLQKPYDIEQLRQALEALRRPPPPG